LKELKAVGLSFILLLDKTPDNAKSIMQGTLGLIQNHRVGTSAENRDGLASCLYTSDLDDTCTSRLNLLNKIC
jgi:hypothetical protein